MRYIENNPVEAGLVQKAEDYPWSSAYSRVHRQSNELLSDYFLTSEVADWSEFLQSKHEEDPPKALLSQRLNTGRPLGTPEFLEKLEWMTGRQLIKNKPGPKSKVGGN